MLTFEPSVNENAIVEGAIVLLVWSDADGGGTMVVAFESKVLEDATLALLLLSLVVEGCIDVTAFEDRLLEGVAAMLI